MTWTSIADAVLGAALIISGVVAVVRRETKASAELEDERVYEGKSAVVLGILWMVLGASFIAFSLTTESSVGVIGQLRKLGSMLLGN
jgi:drug/metabolite transporter (DMT)-like permease